MHRRVAYILVWLAATGATMGAAWLGVRSVLDVATPHRPMPLSVADLRSSPPPAPTTPAPQPTTTRPGPGTSVKPVPAGWTEVSDGHGGTAFERTFHLIGGGLTVLSSEREARVLVARPRPGFAFILTRPDARTLIASLVSLGHTSRVFVTWRGGPYASVSEIG